MFKTTKTTKYNSLLYYPLKPVNIHTYILGHLPIQIQNSISVNVTVGARRPLRLEVETGWMGKQEAGGVSLYVGELGFLHIALAPCREEALHTH